MLLTYPAREQDAEQVVTLNTVIEGVDQSTDRRSAARPLVQRWRVAHQSNGNDRLAAAIEAPSRQRCSAVEPVVADTGWRDIRTRYSDTWATRVCTVWAVG